LSKTEIIHQLKERNQDIDYIILEAALKTFNDAIEDALLNGKRIEIRGFGTFFIKKIKEKYSARNPKTGEIIYVPEKNKVRFKASKKLKKIINE
tara:strand:+ start:196 stop:477 length:282 start_codon:yes stop_codon:yes gene_type:complete